MVALLSTTNAERVDGGWKFTGHKNFGTMTPVWTRLGLHGMRATRSDDTVLEGAFVPDDHIARVLPAAAAGMDLFVLGLFAWALVGFSNVYYAIGKRMLDLTLDYVPQKTSLGLGGASYGQHPGIQHGLAEMIMRCDAMEPHLDSVAEGYAASVLQAGSWGAADAPGWVSKIVGLKEIVTRDAFQVSNLAVEMVGGLGVARKGESERLLRDSRMGQIHPLNPQLTRELVAKIALGIDLDAQPRWA